MQECEIYIGKRLKVAGTFSSAIANPFSNGLSYSKGDLVLKDGELYAALEDMIPGAWDADKWLLTNVASAIPKKTSELENDSGLIKTSDIVWETVTNKLGSAVSTSRSSNFGIYVCRALGLITLTGWCELTSSASEGACTKIFEFNSDLPGNDSERLFSVDGFANTNGALGYVMIRPNACSDETKSRAISVQSTAAWTRADGVNIMTSIINHANEFYAYLDSKD